MRPSVFVIFASCAVIAAAALTFRMASEARAQDGEQPRKGAVTNVRDMSQLMKDPEYRRVKRAEIHSKLEESAVDVVNAVGLTTSQLSQLLELETDFQMSLLDSFAPVVPGTLHPDLAAARASVAKQRELRIRLDADIVALLGAGKAQQFRDYVKSQPARRQVKQLQASLQLAGCPMTAEQSERLIATIAAEQERRNSEMADFRAQLKDGAGANQSLDATRAAELEIDAQENARIIEAATPILSATQLSSLQKMLGDDSTRRRLHLQAHHDEWSTIQ